MPRSWPRGSPYPDFQDARPTTVGSDIVARTTLGASPSGPHLSPKQNDIEYVSDRNEEEFSEPPLCCRVTLDATDAAPQWTLREFVRQIEPQLTAAARKRILTHKALAAQGKAQSSILTGLRAVRLSCTPSIVLATA